MILVVGFVIMILLQATILGYEICGYKDLGIAYEKKIASINKENYMNTVHEIDIDEYRAHIKNGAKGIFVYSRSSCKYCAIATGELSKFADGRLPIYFLNLEKYYLTEDYAPIKKELDFDYLPAFRYIENGKMTYNLNSPVDSTYFDASGDEKQAIYNEMIEKVNAFIDGAAGLGPVINEEVTSEEAVKVTNSNVEATTIEYQNDGQTDVIYQLKCQTNILSLAAIFGITTAFSS